MTPTNSSIQDCPSFQPKFQAYLKLTENLPTTTLPLRPRSHLCLHKHACSFKLMEHRSPAPKRLCPWLSRLMSLRQQTDGWARSRSSTSVGSWRTVKRICQKFALANSAGSQNFMLLKLLLVSKQTLESKTTTELLDWALFPTFGQHLRTPKQAKRSFLLP